MVHKIPDEVTVEEAAILLEDLVDGNKMKMHKDNIYCQFSELKCLKKNLKEDEVIRRITKTNSGMKFRVPILTMKISPFLQQHVVLHKHIN